MNVFLTTNKQMYKQLMSARCHARASGLGSGKERLKYVTWVPLADRGLGKVKGGGFLGLITEITCWNDHRNVSQVSSGTVDQLFDSCMELV